MSGDARRDESEGSDQTTDSGDEEWQGVDARSGVLQQTCPEPGDQDCAAAEGLEHSLCTSAVVGGYQ